MRSSYLILLNVVLSFAYMGFSATNLNLPQKSQVYITFKVVPASLPQNAKVFISGNHEKLGNWNAGAVPMKKNKDGSWGKKLPFKSGDNLEYKITLGSWAKEALDKSGHVPPNSVLDVKSNETLTIFVDKWKSEEFKGQGQITGNLKVHHNIKYEGILPRDVLVWLPKSYEESSQKKYPVLYMHDGQQLFDPATSTHGVDWQVDETVTKLVEQGKMKEIIVVGINNTKDRGSEYSETAKGRAYRNFVIKKLKPFIDKTYRTLPGKEHTGIMGSSMGGLVSFLFVWHHPDIFSMAGCLSPAFVECDILKKVKNNKEKDKNIKIYMDNGGLGLEKKLQPGCEEMLELLEKQGFVRGDNLIWFRDKKAEHNEAAWAKRVWKPLLLMYGIDEPKRIGK